MPSVSATDLINLMNLDESAETLEPLIDLAIDCLNIFGCDINNMSGDAGSKTVTLTSKQKGGVMIISRIIYKSFYKNEDGSSGSLGPAGWNTSDLMSNNVVWTQIETIGSRLIEGNNIAFVVAEDTSGID